MNVIFISPHFPLYFHNFCSCLKNKGVNVLGIGDGDYNYISKETKESLSEYYKVDSLENYDEVHRAVGYFIHKYGRIDFVESQNEYWLETDARIRTDFNINSGTKKENLDVMKYKSKMKGIYESIGIPVARYVLDPSLEDALNFIKEVGYPVVVKPDNGVGAAKTYKLKNKKDLDKFYDQKDKTIYIMEEYIDGQVETFDGITDSSKNILICSSHIMMNSIMDNVNEGFDTVFRCQKVEDSDIKEIGSKVVQAYDTRSKFFHFEFFRLNKDKEGLGKKGDLIGLEVNMRAPGGYIPDMVNYSYDCNVYDIWANMIAYDKSFETPKFKYIVGYAGRRNNVEYYYTNNEIEEMYKADICEKMVVPSALAGAQGDLVYLVRNKEDNEVKTILSNILKRK